MKQLIAFICIIYASLNSTGVWATGADYMQRVMPEAIRAVASEAIRRQFGSHFNHLELAPLARFGRDWPRSYDRLSVDSSSGNMPTARTCVTVHMWKDSIKIDRALACFKVKAFVTSWVAKYDIAQGTALMPSDFEMGEVNVLENQGAVPATPKSLETQRLRISMKKGQVLVKGNIECLPQVSRNQEIELRVLSGNVAIETRAVALLDGEHGSLIPVRLVASNERLDATVEGDGLAIIRIR